MMTHLQLTSNMPTNILTSTAPSNEQQYFLLLAHDLWAAIIFSRVQSLTSTPTQTQTISTNGWSHYTHITLYDIGPWLLHHVLDPWTSLWDLGRGHPGPSPWKHQTITNTYSETYMHINKWRAHIEATQWMQETQYCNLHGFPPLCSIISSSLQRTQHWFTTTIHLQTAMQTLTISNAFTDKQHYIYKQLQYKQTLQASATIDGWLRLSHTEPA